MIQTRQIGSYTEIYSDQNGGGKSATYFITQAETTVFHDFWTRKLLAPGETPDNFIEVTATRKAELEAARDAWTRPPQAFIDMWNEAAIARGDWGRYTVCGIYNENTGYFELNGILDITYKEALLIYEAQQRDTLYSIRTNLPLYIRSCGGDFTNCTNLKVLLGNPHGNSRPKLNTTQNCCFRSICGFRIDSFGGIIFSGWGDVEEIKWMTISAKGTMPLGACKNLTAETVRNMVECNPSGNSIAIHADVMAKLTGDTSNAAAAALSEQERKEWESLGPLAAEKNITFVSA